MGKGGEQSIDAAQTSKKYKLSNLGDDSLRKWAKAYGIKDSDKGKRELLLELLVSWVL